MIACFSEWAKNLTLAVVIVSLFEMLLPNNKTKKYIKVVMGLYILFNIISPFVKKDFSFELENVIENSKSKTVSTEEVNQTSMDTRLKQICKEELEKVYLENNEDKIDAVVICALHKAQNKLVLINQYRVPINK